MDVRNKEKLTNYVLVATPSFFPWQDKKLLADNSTLSNCSPYYMLWNNLLGEGEEKAGPILIGEKLTVVVDGWKVLTQYECPGGEV